MDKLLDRELANKYGPTSDVLKAVREAVRRSAATTLEEVGSADTLLRVRNRILAQIGEALPAPPSVGEK